MKCTFLLFEISYISVNYLKMTCFCSLKNSGILENKHIYFCSQFSKYENIFCFIFNVQMNLLINMIKQII